MLRDALEVVRGAVRDPAEDDLLGGPAGEEDHHQVDELLARVQVAVLGRHVERVAERLPARDDRRLLRREEVADEVGHDRVPGLVVGEDPLLLLGDDAALLEPGDDALHGAPRSPRSGCTAAPVRAARIAASLQRFARSAPVSPEVWRATRSRSTSAASGLPRRVDAEDRLASGDVRRGHVDLPVEASRAQQRGVEILEPVRRGHDDHLVARAEAVELDEELVQRLVVLAVEASARTRRADGVELVDEDDRRRVLARLLEELADAGGAEAREHLDERRRARGVEVRARCARDGLREQRLAGPGRAVQQDAARHARTEPLEASAVTQELDDLLELLLRLVEARRRRSTTTSTCEPLTTGAGLARGMKRIVQMRRAMTTPKKTIGSHVISVYSRSPTHAAYRHGRHRASRAAVV